MAAGRPSGHRDHASTRRSGTPLRPLRADASWSVCAGRDAQGVAPSERSRNSRRDVHSVCERRGPDGCGCRSIGFGRWPRIGERRFVRGAVDMTLEMPTTNKSGNVARSPRRLAIPRIGRLALKELRETLRDRRTIATLFLMPILVYPLLSVAFQRFLVSNLRNVAASSEYAIGFRTEREAKEFGNYLVLGDSILEDRDNLRTTM